MEELNKMEDAGATGKQVGTFEDPILILNDEDASVDYWFSAKRALKTIPPYRELPTCTSRVVNLL